MKPQALTLEQLIALQPQIPDSLSKLDKAASQSIGLNLAHLIKLRASQINGCAFCINMHCVEARKDGEQQTRLDLLSAWRHAACYSDAEKTALLWTEILTRVDHSKTESAFIELSQHFNEQQIVDLTGLITVINSWNRIVAGMGLEPEV